MIFRNEIGTIITLLQWLAPTQYTDGRELDPTTLTYNLYSRPSDSSDPFEHVSSFPGTLNPEGKYQYPLADVAAFDQQGRYEIALTAVSELGVESDRSGTMILTVAARPNAPSELEGVPE